MTVTIRPYQHSAIDGTFRAFEKFDSTLLVMPTGTGKTTVFVTIGQRWPAPQRVLVIAHREELIQQAAERVERLTGQWPGIEMACDKVDQNDPCKWVVSSVQTLSRETRLCKFEPSQFGLVIVDEAHHAVASTYRRVLGHFQRNRDCKTLGVTATPLRADALAMEQVFQSVAYNYGIEQAADEGWLVPVRQQVVRVDGLDFSKVRTTAGDLNEGDLEAILNEEKILHRVAAPTVELAGNLPTLVFCVTVAHAEKMAEILRRYKPGSAEFVCGTTPKEDRRRIIGDFRSGRLQFLCNVGVLLEGFDAPNCACIAMARPTKSLALYTQVIGRSLRALPGVIDGMETATADARRAAIAASLKPSALILDYAGNAGKHKIITAYDVLGGKWGEPVRSYARKTAEEEGNAAMLGDSLERASDELAFLDEVKERRRQRAEEEAARERIKAEASWSTHDVSLMGGTSSGAARADTPTDGPTDKQLNFLSYLGVPRSTARQYSRRQASTVIDKLKAQKGIK